MKHAVSRRVWKILIIALIGMGLLAAAGAAGAFFLLQYREYRFLRRAEENFAKSQWNEAKRNYAWYLTKHPDDVAALEKYAEACSNILPDRRGSLRDVARAYFQIAIHDPSNDNLILKLLRFQQKHFFWEEVEYSASYFLRQRPEGGPPGIRDVLRYYHALALDRMGRQKDAIDEYSLLAADGTTQIEVYVNLINLLRQQGLGEQAEAASTQAEERFPDHPRLHVQRAKSLLEARDLSQAEQEMDQALQRGATDPEVLLQATQVAMVQKKWDQAAHYAEQASALAPDRVEPYLALAYLHERQGEPGEAIALLAGIAPFIRADNPELYLTLAELQ